MAKPRCIGRIALLGMVLAAPALAQTSQSGWYGAVRAGVTLVPDTDVGGLNLRAATLIPAPTDRLTYDAGWTAVVAAGYQMNALRAELELSERKAAIATAFGDPKSVPGIGLCVISMPNCASVGPTGGITEVQTAVVNGYYDMPLGVLTPYLGAGLGVADIHEEHVGQPRGILLTGSAASFAYQFVAGVSYALAPRIRVDLDYRYLGTTTQQFHPDRFSNPLPSAAFTGHSIVIGVRYFFLRP